MHSCDEIEKGMLVLQCREVEISVFNLLLCLFLPIFRLLFSIKTTGGRGEAIDSNNGSPHFFAGTFFLLVVASINSHTELLWVGERFVQGA